VGEVHRRAHGISVRLTTDDQRRPTRADADGEPSFDRPSLALFSEPASPDRRTALTNVASSSARTDRGYQPNGSTGDGARRRGARNVAGSSRFGGASDVRYGCGEGITKGLDQRRVAPEGAGRDGSTAAAPSSDHISLSRPERISSTSTFHSSFLRLARHLLRSEWGRGAVKGDTRNVACTSYVVKPGRCSSAA
jgi:hypothetical protein